LSTKIVIQSDLEKVSQLEDCLLREVVDHGFNEGAVFAIKLALEEGLMNALKHGNGGDNSKKIEVVYEINRKKAEFTIKDEGCGFNPCCVPDPTKDENLEKPTGRGIMLMRAYMDEVDYTQGGNQVYMVKLNT